MAAVDIFDVRVLDNPAPFTNPLQFEITYDVREALKEGKLISHPACFSFTPRFSMAPDFCPLSLSW